VDLLRIGEGGGGAGGCVGAHGSGGSQNRRPRTRLRKKKKTPDTEADRLSRDEEEAQIRRAPAELVAGSPRRARHIFVRPMCPRGKYLLVYLFCVSSTTGWWRSWLARRSHSYSRVILRSRVRASLTPRLANVMMKYSCDTWVVTISHL
jgi:hypothetical protein